MSNEWERLVRAHLDEGLARMDRELEALDANIEDHKQHQPWVIGIMIGIWVLGIFMLATDNPFFDRVLVSFMLAGLLVQVWLIATTEIRCRRRLKEARRG